MHQRCIRSSRTYSQQWKALTNEFTLPVMLKKLSRGASTNTRSPSAAVFGPLGMIKTSGGFLNALAGPFQLNIWCIRTVCTPTCAFLFTTHCDIGDCARFAPALALLGEGEREAIIW